MLVETYIVSVIRPPRFYRTDPTSRSPEKKSRDRPRYDAKPARVCFYSNFLTSLSDFEGKGRATSQSSPRISWGVYGGHQSVIQGDSRRRRTGKRILIRSARQIKPGSGQTRAASRSEWVRCSSNIINFRFWWRYRILRARVLAWLGGANFSNDAGFGVLSPGGIFIEMG